MPDQASRIEYRKIVLATALIGLTFQSFSFNLREGHTVVQIGGHFAHQGKQQFSAMDGLIGNIYTVNQHHDSNGLVGLGYLLPAPSFNDHMDLFYGLNAFFLAKTAVSGSVIQETMFTNLAYQYHVTHFPVFATAKAVIHKTPQYGLTFDAGIGPNFMKTASFGETSLDGVTIPDHPFSGHVSTTFSAMAGVGLKINNAFGHAPIECGYRFFYLGQGELTQNTPQIAHHLKTGQNYSNAVLCSVTI